jgi:protein-S-isoprenylcysteine O-methyltransferase Ste14
MICIQCSYRIPDALGACPNCGRPAEAVPGATRSRSPRAGTRHGPFIDVSRWTERDRIAGIASAVLLVSLFLPWCGASFLGMTVTLNGLESYGYLHIVLVLCLAILGYLAMRISPIRSALPAPRIHERILLTATAVNLALVIVAFIAIPGGYLVSRQYGAFVGGLAALTAVVPLGAAVFSITSQWPGL